MVILVCNLHLVLISFIGSCPLTKTNGTRREKEQRALYEVETQKDLLVMAYIPPDYSIYVSLLRMSTGMMPEKLTCPIEHSTTVLQAANLISNSMYFYPLSPPGRS